MQSHTNSKAVPTGELLQSVCLSWAFLSCILFAVLRFVVETNPSDCSDKLERLISEMIHYLLYLQNQQVAGSTSGRHARGQRPWASRSDACASVTK